ncbi:hypothetical protein EJ05DRAFT_472467 [Pseudovirgaria hyperparasitica]|uniref:Uncharacterized protein n=1 Tax=Pseudovirgaria hyperparasitica TaxID=470096 RepID=A0A6A6WMW4_9PEZI|nr:uncharacterized protein EJ05DRAFT_472467 [Pseudovirgaria hyperparasitica]KAF2763574.1 hypothetical protein EJ05DRAFT_472467 [Pseudovirgaria hyperparasitica]
MALGCTFLKILLKTRYPPTEDQTDYWQDTLQLSQASADDASTNTNSFIFYCILSILYTTGVGLNLNDIGGGKLEWLPARPPLVNLDA